LGSSGIVLVRGHHTNTPVPTINRCSTKCTPWFVTDTWYKLGRCQIENTRLNTKNAPTGLVNIFNPLNAQLGRSKGRISQSGVPIIRNGGAMSVMRTC